LGRAKFARVEREKIIMKTKLYLIGFIVLGTICAQAATTNDLATTLRNGLFEEQVNHNLDAAIATYQTLVTQFDKDRQLAATAAFRLGECYRTLGKTNEAAAQYERVLRDFPDQTTLATLSRQNLAGLGQTLATSSAVSQSARQEQKRLLEDEIKLAEQQQETLKKQIEVGLVPPDDLLAKQREILALRQRLAALADNIDVKSGSDEEDQEIRRIQTMIQNSPDLINAPVTGDQTPLVTAAEQGQLRVAQYLLDNNADVNLSRSGETALVFAARSGHKAMVELLLRRGADANSQRRALQLAAQNGFKAVAEILIANKTDVNAPGADGNTALHSAADFGRAALVELLLANGAKANITNEAGITPLGLAAKKDLASVKALLAAKADPNGGTFNLPLHVAVGGTDAAIVDALLQAGADANRSAKSTGSGSSPATPLLLALAGNKTDFVKLLLAYKADPNGKGRKDLPIILDATQSPAILKALLEAGANPNVQTSEGHTPLFFSTMNDDSDSVNALLSHGADKEAGAPLIQAALNHRLKAAEALLKAGAEVNVRSTDKGKTPLLFAAGKNDLEMATLLLAYKADPNLRDENGNTPLVLAKAFRPPQASSTDLLDLLRKHGALDNLPMFDRIQVARPSANFAQTVFLKGTNDWNRFTLLELIAAHYGFASTVSSDPLSFDPNSVTRSGSLAFPSLEQIIIVRPATQGGEAQRINVDLDGIFKSGDCSRDVQLAWGDTIEISETDHPINLNWQGFSQDARITLQNCLKRQVQLTVKDQTTNFVLMPKTVTGSTTTFGAYGRIIWEAPQFTLSPVLNKTGLLRTSSDLSHVKVIRRDPVTGKQREWILDCSNPQSSPALWLRDGDVIEVPEK
jgi:ankyrin repeat protein